MKNKYILLRHGETPYQAKGLNLLYPNPFDDSVQLTARGKKMIKDAILEIKKKHKIDLIYSSPVYRTRQSSKIALEILKIKPKYDERLTDINFGIYNGRPIDDLWKDISQQEFFYKRPPKGENRRDVKKRVVSFFKEIDKQYKDKTILVISHADPIWMLASYLKGYTEKEILKHKKEDHPKVGHYVVI